VEIVLAVAGAAALGAAWAWVRVRSRRAFSSVAERATYEVLHTANEAAPPFRTGLDPVSAHRAIRHLRALLGTPAVALTDTVTTLAWDGCGEHHAAALPGLVTPVVVSGRRLVIGGADLACDDPACPLQAAVAVPIIVDDVVVGTLCAFGPSVGAGLLQTTSALSRWIATQLELAELDEARLRLAESELQLLRAQISPHFIYNALTAIASFVRTDPDRARELLVGFADFTRYSFRSHGEFTTLAEELRSIDTYLLLERARFGERLTVTVRVAPEVLGVTVPFLVLQPLVENAVRHGIERSGRVGRIAIVAEDDGAECRIVVEDDGPGMDPGPLQLRLDGRLPDTAGGIGMRNVDERLRKVFGPAYGLEVETGVGAGTRIVLRIPKYSSGVRAS
jgi:two-component system LytT family sensor kinase